MTTTAKKSIQIALTCAKSALSMSDDISAINGKPRRFERLIEFHESTLASLELDIISDEAVTAALQLMEIELHKANTMPSNIPFASGGMSFTS